MQINEGRQAVVRISDPGEIAAAVPHLLGFRPQESVVLVGLGGPTGKRVGMTARADIPPPGSTGRVVADVVQRFVRGGPAAAVVVVVSDDDPADPEGGRDLPHRDLVHASVLALDARGVPVRDALLVRDGRWWSFDCPHPCCAPGAGTPLPERVSALAAASVTDGHVVAENRAALVARLARQRDPAGAVAAAVLRTGQDCATRRLAGGAEQLADESWSRILEAVACLRPGSVRALPDEQLARVAWGLRDVLVRDRALGLALHDDADAAAQLWTECTRRMPSPLDAAPATLLAVSAWLRGDGTTAGVALERALDSDPDYSMAELLAEALARCVTPSQLRAWLAEGPGS